MLHSGSSRYPSPSEVHPGLSIIAPVYNEVDNLEELCQRVVEAIEPGGQAFELILVNDGSTDGSKQKLDALAAQDPRVKVIHFARNYGQTAAMSAGFHAAGHEIIVTLDADLQNDPKDIPKLLAKLDEGYDVVCGWRKDRQDPWLTRVFPSKVANKIISVASNVPLHDYGCTLRAYHREFLEDIPLYGEMHRFIPIYVTWAGARLVEMPVGHHPRTRGTSKYGLSRIFKVLLDMVTVKFLRDYYVNPIYFFGYFGFLLAFSGVGSMGAAVFMKFQYGTWMHKNPFVIFSVMFLIMALMMFMMGVIAEVLIRMNFEIQHKPPFKIREMRNLEGVLKQAGDTEAVSPVAGSVVSETHEEEPPLLDGGWGSSWTTHTPGTARGGRADALAGPGDTWRSSLANRAVGEGDVGHLEAETPKEAVLKAGALLQAPHEPSQGMVAGANRVSSPPSGEEQAWDAPTEAGKGKGVSQASRGR